MSNEYVCPKCDYETVLFEVDEEDFEPDEGNLFYSSDAPSCPECTPDESWARPLALVPKEEAENDV